MQEAVVSNEQYFCVDCVRIFRFPGREQVELIARSLATRKELATYVENVKKLTMPLEVYYGREYGTIDKVKYYFKLFETHPITKNDYLILSTLTTEARELLLPGKFPWLDNLSCVKCGTPISDTCAHEQLTSPELQLYLTGIEWFRDRQ